MTYAYIDFSGETSNAQPSGWTTRFSTSSHTWRVVDSDSATGSKFLRGKSTTTSNYRNAISWDAYSAEDIDIVVRMKASDRNTGSATNYLHAGVFARGSGAAGSEECYSLALYASSGARTLGLSKFVSGSETSLDTDAFAWTVDTPYWMRLKVSGTTIKGKIWTGDRTDEPLAWNVSATDEDVAGSGWVGLWRYYNSDNMYDYDVVEIDPPDWIDSSYHVHSAESVSPTKLGTLALDDAYHSARDSSTVGDVFLCNRTVVIPDDCYHPAYCDQLGYSELDQWTTDNEDGDRNLLPVLEGYGEFYTNMSLEGTFPGFSLESSFWADMEGKLPTLSLSATMTSGAVMSLEGRLGTMTLDSNGFATAEGKLPTLSLDAEMSQPYSSMSLEGKFPVMSLEGAFYADFTGKLGGLSLDATMISGGVMSMEGKLFTMELEGDFWADMEGVFSSFSLDASMGARTMSLEDGQLGGFTLDAEVSPGGFMSLEGSLSPIILNASMISGGLMSLEGKLSALRVSELSFIDGGVMSLEGTLPGFTCEAVMSAAVMELEGVMGALVSGEYPGIVSVMTKPSRFDNYVLRHVR